MAIKGVVFDFNGTMFWDTHLHNIAWDKFLNTHGIELSNEEKLSFLHGKNNNQIIKEVFGKGLSLEETEKLGIDKETIYQQLCRDENLRLAPGIVSFFNFLKEKQIPFTIATASIRFNVDFFFEFLGLEEWFNKELVIYDNGKVKSKPDPEFFKLAIRNLGVNAQDVLIFEDSVTGIKAAENSGAGKVIIMNSTGFDYSMFDHDVIRDFEMVDRSMF